MSDPISLRIDEQDRPALLIAAQEAGIGLGTYLRHLIHERAEELRVAQIRGETRAVGKRAASRATVRRFYEDLGTPNGRV